MLNTLLVSPSRAVADSITDFGEQIEWFRLIDWTDHYPNIHELFRQINQKDVDVLLIDFTDRDAAQSLSRAARNHFDDLVILSFGTGWDDESVEFAEAAGIDGLLVSPVKAPQLRKLIEDVFRLRRTDRVSNLYAFVPAKAGAGTSTLVQQTAGMMSLLHGSRILALECDLRSGLLSEMLNIDPKRFIQDAFECASSLGAPQWERMVVRRISVQWMLTDRSRKQVQPHWLDYQRILYFASSRYDWILADLPEFLDPASSEVVRCAKKVYVVTTPDVPSLRLAASCCNELIERSVAPDRIAILLNRWNEDDITASDVEEHLGYPVAALIPEDHPAIRQAILDGGLVGIESPIRRAVADFTQQLAGRELPAPAPEPEPEPAAKSNVLLRVKKLLF